VTEGGLKTYKRGWRIAYTSSNSDQEPHGHDATGKTENHYEQSRVVGEGMINTCINLKHIYLGQKKCFQKNASSRGGTRGCNQRKKKNLRRTQKTEQKANDQHAKNELRGIDSHRCNPPKRNRRNGGQGNEKNSGSHWEKEGDEGDSFQMEKH